MVLAHISQAHAYWPGDRRTNRPTGHTFNRQLLREDPVPYDFTLTAIIPATAQDIYDAWLDSFGHSEMTRGAAVMSDEVGADVSAWDGYITGRNLELVPAERIVQSWRTTEFTDEHGDSVVTVTLEDADGGTLLTLVHSNVPEGQTSYEQGGWQTFYFEPMRDYFAKRTRPFAVKKTKAAAPKKELKRATTKTKGKRKAASKTKAAAGRKKLKGAAAAKPKPKRTTKAKTKPTRVKRRGVKRRG